jgi:hypothetical protein
MSGEKLRRKAGAQGVGVSDGDPETEAPESEKPARTPEQTRAILAPEVLKFEITRKVADPDAGVTVDRKFILCVPTQFTIGEIVKSVAQDFDAYVRLVMVELRKVSSIDVASNPQLMFSRANMDYLEVALIASNVREFMGRVLSKSAYILDPDDAEEKKLILRSSDVEQLNENDAWVITIGASYVNRWLTRWLEAHKALKEKLDAKNAAGAAQT